MIWVPLVLFLLAVAAVYVGTVRAAFTSVLRLPVRFVVERHARGDSLARYLEDPTLLFVPARIILGLILVGATPLLVLLIGGQRPHQLTILVASLAGFALLCEQILPQLIIRRDPQTWLDLLLPSFDVFTGPLEPLTMWMMGAPTRTPAGTEEEVAAAATDAHPEEEPEVHETAAERQLIRSVVDFGDRLVREVMTPRPDIVAIRGEATLDELRQLFKNEEYSRIPVYQQSLDNILGVVFVKDLIRADVVAGDTRPVTSLMRPAYFVPETKRVPELLREFQQKQVQQAIVVDEYGGTAGLVTIEDLLEELVGEIRDEYDVEAEPVVEESGGVFLFNGKVHIDEVFDRLGVEVEAGGFETVNGMLLSELGRVPAVGERVEISGLEVEVVEAERRRVKKVRIRRVVPAPDQPEHESARGGR